ncbi:formylglycine-generating enzyme family protein [Muricauda sp. ANG21]|uniref:formylglycine-generating enzyme family protein n=1 Tax=Allomuricauda sp. ANG21 TaxID=3042468 RepID=UPI0034554D78
MIQKKNTMEFLHFAFCTLLLLVGCDGKKRNDQGESKGLADEGVEVIKRQPENVKAPDGMVWVPGGKFYQGAVSTDKMAMAHEKPRHAVELDGFFMDIHEVTNAQFARFVSETGYVTVAEREIKWEEMKKQLPQGTPRPPDSILQPGSLVFKKTKSSVPNLYDYSQWWEWKIGANWKEPYGPGSTIQGKDEHPVVHIAYEDALAYCNWAGRRLPTEAEWEYAARAGKDNGVFFWGDDISKLASHANTWEGEFPVKNTQKDGFERSAPVMSYPKNDFGLYDMAGNVWEWTSDWYNTSYYQEMLSNTTIPKNPRGAEVPFNRNNPYARERVIKGGSFLCSASYCASYRISARMATSPDSGMEHLGFRTVLGASEAMEHNK